MKNTIYVSDIHYLGFGRLLSELGGFFTSMRVGIGLLAAPIIYYNFKHKLISDRENSSETKFKRRVSFQGIYNLHDKVEHIIDEYEK